jgi:CHAD domain-containing protein
VAKTQDVSFRNWAEMRLGQAAENFFSAVPNQVTDLSALHQFRIRGKQLRYTLELLAPAFGPELRKVHYPIVEELQEQLGKVNDCVAADARLRRWRRKSDSPGEQEILGQLIERQRFQLDEAVAQYRSWWTAERAEMLRQGLATLIGQNGTGDQPTRADEVEESAVSQA